MPNDDLPADLVRLLGLAKVEFLAGRFDAAERLLDAFDGHESVLAAADQGPSSPLTVLRAEIGVQMANAYLGRGQTGPALGHLEQALRLGADASVGARFIGLLRGGRFAAPRPSLRPVLVRALEERWASPIQVGRICAQLIGLDEACRTLAAAADDASLLLSPAAQTLMTDPLLLSLLQRAIVADPALEQVLAKLRRASLHLATTEGLGSSLDAAIVGPFLGALANQCFATEYAYPLPEDEAAQLAALLERSQLELASGGGPGPVEVGVVAAYVALHQALDAKQLLDRTWPAWLQPVIGRQVSEPLEELELARGIPTVTKVRDPGSLAVQDQYEHNPFPRWLDVPVRGNQIKLPDWLNAEFGAGAALRGRHCEVLVAGCGTGAETATLRRWFCDASFFAIDLSRASLAHAERKARELGLKDVTFACADLLELRSLGRQFDMTVSAGVLHHLDDPLEGWRVLTDVTRTGGCMQIALYSELGRRQLAPARAFAEAGGYGVTASELRRFRSDVMSLPATPEFGWRAALLMRDDFYSLSMLRDLIFHVRETRFTIERIGSAVESLGLRFCGFMADPATKSAFLGRFGAAADGASLGQWAAFEADNPDTFAGMYHFVVEKT